MTEETPMPEPKKKNNNEAMLKHLNDFTANEDIVSFVFVATTPRGPVATGGVNDKDVLLLVGQLEATKFDLQMEMKARAAQAQLQAPQVAPPAEAPVDANPT